MKELWIFFEEEEEMKDDLNTNVFRVDRICGKDIHEVE